MPLVLVTTPGATDANTYCDLAAAEAYWATLTFKSAIAGKGDEDKKAALIQAARVMDDGLNWKGTKGTAAQALEWPRVGVTDRNGFAVDYTIIPSRVRNACAEQAMRMLVKDLNAPAGEAIQLGTLHIPSGNRSPIAPSTKEMVSQYTKGNGGISLERC